MRALLLALLFTVPACNKPPPVAPPAPVVEAEPPPDVGNADDLFQRAYGLKDEHPGESIRLYKKAAQLEPNDAPLQAKVKEALSKFEPLMRDRAREAYLLGFELRESSPNDAARNFEQAMDLSPRGDAIYEKAKAQLAKVKIPPPTPGRKR